VAGRFFSLLTPELPGPRKFGQSAAGALRARTATTGNDHRVFMLHLQKNGCTLLVPACLVVAGTV
jgi:hypothetical protein